MFGCGRIADCYFAFVGGHMDAEIIFKLAAIGIMVAVLNQLLIKSGRDEQAMMVVIAGLVVAMFIMIDQISTLFDTVKSTFGF